MPLTYLSPRGSIRYADSQEFDRIPGVDGTYLVRLHSEARVVSQQSFDLGAEIGFAATGVVQEGAAFSRGQVGRLSEQGLHARTMLLIHGFADRLRRADSIACQGVPSPRRDANQARA